ncbi:hypothetical protein [Pseudomonas putida]|uniref:Protein-PII uridylyltransferase N-terminal domain-containing protein n=1 Tax=Pseudomonas putida TaxID=303 RepID=A0A6I6XXB9_PSEPU|nr:hypothetical protein [Pseudomonas putida]QHG64792.1 hypothetical protein C2H86_10355 [Pseudomonas putida]
MDFNGFDEHPYLKERFTYSCKAIAHLRQSFDHTIAPLVKPSELSVVAVGSYGRCEVSCVSDMDFFILHDRGMSPAVLAQVLQQTTEKLRTLSLPGESDKEKFSAAALVERSILSANIGGKRESSDTLTRRMLLLLESRSLFGDACLGDTQQDLLREYVPDNQGRGLARFMLNDLVRYYRTLMSNFEEKVVEGKAWGVRNIKLRFSRKLLFMGGIVLIAQSCGLPGEGKRNRIRHLSRYTPLQRLALLGQENPHTPIVLEQYACFLRMVSSPANRQLLDSLQPVQALREPLYREFRALGKCFSTSLQQWLQAQYPEHPIHDALLF